ncbi:MAG: transketolase family protein [Candidatus Sericytochromatia bacterium]
MRTAFIETLLALAAEDERIWLLTGDLGYSVLEPFAERFPERFVNAGIAEQNLTGVAAGLALSGKTALTYSIANFPVMRCLEQIRNDVCYHALDVKIVAVGGGLAYGPLGYSHHGSEDLAVLRVLPHMTVFAPGDPVEARLATRAMLETPGPCYLRLGKAGEPVVHTAEPPFAVGRALRLREGVDLTIMSTGAMLASAAAVAERLAAEGYAVRQLSFPTLAPFDAAAVCAAAEETGGILTIEEHGQGGLGTAVAEVLAALGRPVRFRAITLGREPGHTAGDQETLRDRHGLSVEAIAARALALV